MYRSPREPNPSRMNFDEENFSNIETKHEDISSRIHINKTFQDESKKIRKRFRINKRNPSSNNKYYKGLTQYKNKNLSLFKNTKADHVMQTSLPNTVTYTYEGLGSRVYNCKFTNDGKILLVTSQSGVAFFKFNEDDTISLKSVIPCVGVHWAISDADISSNSRYMVQSTLGPNVQMFDVETKKYCQTYNFQSGGNGDPDEEFSYWGNSIRIYSIKMSDDMNEIIAGCGSKTTGAPVQVYDREANKIKHSIIAHADDVNTICYVDKKNSSTFITGSDDGTCKLWDTRILKNNSPVGVFYGHVSGITSVSSREDTYYFCSNGKDQSLKLWDLRKASNDLKRKVDLLRHDYRYELLSQQHIEKIKKIQVKSNDMAVMSFWGHNVHHTLIRAHFSPEYSTGRRFLYTGSYDGAVYIYDILTGETVSVLEVPKSGGYDVNVVRDCIWHPFSQNLISTSFNGEIHRWEHLDTSDAKPIPKQISRPNGPGYVLYGDRDDVGDGEDDDGDENYEDIESGDFEEEEDDSEFKPDDDEVY